MRITLHDTALQNMAAILTQKIQEIDERLRVTYRERPPVFTRSKVIFRYQVAIHVFGKKKYYIVGELKAERDSIETSDFIRSINSQALGGLVSEMALFVLRQNEEEDDGSSTGVWVETY